MKGFLVSAVVCVALAIFKVVFIDLSAPFLLVWVMIWFIGGSIDSKSSS